jgi:hypothetical protein
MIRILPDFACGSTGGVVVNIIDTSPDTTAVVAGAAPL